MFIRMTTSSNGKAYCSIPARLSFYRSESIGAQHNLPRPRRTQLLYLDGFQSNEVGEGPSWITHDLFAYLHLKRTHNCTTKTQTLFYIVLNRGGCLIFAIALVVVITLITNNLNIYIVWVLLLLIVHFRTP